MPTLGAAIVPGRSIDQAVERVQLAERLGYDSVWMSQLPDARDTPLVLARYAAATERIGLGTAVMPIYTRHPTAMAQMAATLDEISGGRFRLGLGVAHQITVEHFWGLKLEHPVEAMREYITILRNTFREGGSQVEGDHFTARWVYNAPHSGELPILVAALGPRMLELAGEISDGVVLWMCAPSYIENVVVPRVSAGLERAGRSRDSFSIVAAVPLCLTTDPAAAMEAFRPTAIRYASLPFYRRALVGAGFSEEELDTGADRVVTDLAGIGDHSALREALGRYAAAGADVLQVGPFNAAGSAGTEKTFEVAIAG